MVKVIVRRNGSGDSKEEAYQRHVANEHWGDPTYHDDPSNPDGCFYCGNMNHPSDCCPDGQAKDEYWESW